MFKNYSLVLCSFCILIFYVATIHKSVSQKFLIQTNTEIDSLDATPGILQLVERAKKNGSHKILIPKGTYHFHPLKAFEKYVTISNNDKGVKRIVFPIIDFHNLEIDGQGSNFIIHGAMVPFLIENSTNISLKNFSIDWKRPFHSEGTVVAVNKSEQTFDLKMSEEFPYAIRGNELIYLGENGYEQGLQQNIFFDPNTKGLVYDNTKYLMDPWMKRLDYEYSAKENFSGSSKNFRYYSRSFTRAGLGLCHKG